MESADISRIGRALTPAERGHRLVLENPDLRDRFAANLFFDHIGRNDLEAAAQWESCSQDEREYWQTRVLVMARDAAATYPIQPDPDPGPGTPAGGVEYDLRKHVA